MASKQAKVELTKSLVSLASHVGRTLVNYIGKRQDAEDALEKIRNNRALLEPICCGHAKALVECSKLVSHYKDTSVRRTRFAQLVKEQVAATLAIITNGRETERLTSEQKRRLGSARSVLSVIKTIVQKNPKQGLAWASGNYKVTFAEARENAYGSRKQDFNKLSGDQQAVVLLKRIKIQDNVIAITKLANAMLRFAASLKAEKNKAVVIRTRKSA